MSGRLREVVVWTGLTVYIWEKAPANSVSCLCCRVTQYVMQSPSLENVFLLYFSETLDAKMDSSHRFKLTPEYTMHQCIACKISVFWLKRRPFTFIFFITASANIKSGSFYWRKDKRRKKLTWKLWYLLICNCF